LAKCAPGHRRPPSGERRGLVNDRRPAPHRACSWVLHFSSHPSRERRRLRVVGSHRFTVRAARAVKWGGPGHNGSWLLPILARVYAIGSTQSVALRRLEYEKSTATPSGLLRGSSPAARRVKTRRVRTRVIVRRQKRLSCSALRRSPPFTRARDQPRGPREEDQAHVFQRRCNSLESRLHVASRRKDSLR